MQNKGALKFLIAVLVIACAYQLSFTFVTRHVEKKAARYAAQFPLEQQEGKEQIFLDSMKTQTVYNLGFIKYNYKEVKEKELNLGLDLKGGMNVTLEVSVEDVLRALSDHSKDPIFNQALAQASANMKNSSDDYISLFTRSYNELSGGGRLSYIFNTPDLKEQINVNSSNEEVIRVLRRESDNAIANSFNVLRNRIDRFGVTQPNIQRLENSGRILVELPGVKEPERVRKLLQGTASLEFWATYENTEIYPILSQANEFIRTINEANGGTTTVETAVEPENETLSSEAAATEGADLLSQIESEDAEDNSKEIAAQFPLFSKLNPVIDPRTNQPAEGPVVGHAMSYDTAAVNAMFNIAQVRALLPRDVKLMWSAKGMDDAGSVFALYAIKANTRDGRAPLDGGVVTSAKQEYAQRGASSEVDMVMNAAGAKAWARLTADNIGRSIAIVLDGYVYSAPRVNNEITGGRSQITGNFTVQEAQDLANVLMSGKLPAPARITQEAVVGPSLGQESIDAGMMSFVIAFLLVLFYMVFYYNKAGFAADIALLFNLFFLFGILASFGAVLTLPGIAGIVLTMGMAIDANVLIYERIKEELRHGKGIGEAVKDGFSNAYSAIIDGQVTTLITGIVLFIFGTGPVQGFATTLIIGIITSLFTSIFITRLIIVSQVEKGHKVKLSNKFTENFLYGLNINFINKRKVSYIAWALMVVIAVGSLATRGMNYGVDFSGGRAYVVRFDKEVTANQVREALSTVFASDDATESYEVKQYGKENQMRIVTQYKYDDASDNTSAEVGELLYKALAPLYSYDISLEAFLTTQTDINGIISADKVGPSIANDIKRDSLIAVLFSLLAIGLYIIIRFKRFAWGAGAVVALALDAFLTIGLFSLLYGVMPFNLEVNQSFIAAILTIIGYSVNDKVIIFDRIREYLRLYPKRDLKTNINNAINSTLARTLNTSFSTILPLLAIFIFGGEVIRGFIFALIFGIFVGTLSSIFIATPIAYDIIMRQGAKKA